jgi:hypothetical protein
LRDSIGMRTLLLFDGRKRGFAYVNRVGERVQPLAG